MNSSLLIMFLLGHMTIYICNSQNKLISWRSLWLSTFDIFLLRYAINNKLLFKINTEKVFRKLIRTKPLLQGKNLVKNFLLYCIHHQLWCYCKITTTLLLGSRKAVKEMHTNFARNSSSAWKHFQEKIPIMWKTH